MTVIRPHPKLRAAHPHLTEAELLELHDFLERYLDIVLRIHADIEKRRALTTHEGDARMNDPSSAPAS